jgi:tetratricopeptide (TPR) repeat protein
VIIVSEGQLEEIEQHLEQGLFLRAYQVSRQIGPLTEWNGCDACVCAGRLAYNLGAPRLSRVLLRRAYTQHPDSLRAYVYELSRVHESYGPVAALRFLDTAPAPKNGEPGDTLALLLGKSLLFGKFRDFSSANRYLKAAERIDPTDRSVLLQRCILHELEDRYEEALRLCEVLLREHPDFAAGAGYFAHLLLLSNRFSQALTFLSDKTSSLECFKLCIQIVTILMELENYEECSPYLQEISRLTPLKEKSLDKWLRATDFQVQYCSGHFDRAVRIAATLPDKGKPEYLRRLSAKTPVKRVRLSVPFVRQHHDTCAPATLSAFTQYWGRPTPHLRIVESICYNGTPSYKMR